MTQLTVNHPIESILVEKQSELFKIRTSSLSFDLGRRISQPNSIIDILEFCKIENSIIYTIRKKSVGSRFSERFSAVKEAPNQLFFEF